MIIEFHKIFRFFKNHPWIADILSVIGGIYYFAQSCSLAHFIDLTMDEGTYLMKGVLFASGQYQPFQFYGPRTSKMPLAYLIPGFFENIFSPGIRTGRYISIGFAMIMLVGLWYLLYRLRGHWWAFLGVWVLALGTGNIINYSQAITQPIVAALLVWSLAFTLGTKQPIWKIALGSLLAISIFLLRQNMLPFALLLIPYIFWQHGKQSGYVALGIMGVVFISVHIIYWPNILSIYTFLPSKITPFLNQWRITFEDPGITQDVVSRSLLGNIFNFVDAYRYNFLAVLGGVFGLLFFPSKKSWKDQSSYKISLFLWVTFIILIIVHIFAAFGMESYRVKSYLFRYMGFFGFLGIIILAVSSHSFSRQDNPLKIMAMVVIALVSTSTIFLAAYQVIKDPIMNLQVPRTRNLQILPGSTDLWRALSNKFHLSYESLQMILPAAFGLFVGFLIVGICLLVTRQLHKRGKVSGYGYNLFLSLVLFGLVLTPTQIFNSNVISDQCEFDVIQANEQVGDYLNQIIPPGSLVYWDSNNSPVPLLYLENVKVFPPQLDQIWNFNVGGDPDLTYKYGFWNQQLADQWMQEADYLLITDLLVGNYTSDPNFSLQYKELSPLNQPIGCRDKSIIHIYQKMQ